MEQTLSKKDKRLEKKKRKVEAFLRLAAENEAERIVPRKKQKNDSSSSEDSSDDNRHKRKTVQPLREKEKETSKEETPSSSSSDDGAGGSEQAKKNAKDTDWKALRAAVIARRKLSMERPKLFLRAEYQSLNLSETPDPEAEKTAQPLFIIDIQHLLLYAVEGNLTSYKPRFCSLLRWRKLSQSMVIAVDGLTIDDYLDNKECFPYLSEAFDIKVPLVSPTQYDSSISEELFNVPLSGEQIRKLRDKSKDANTRVFKRLHQEIKKKKQVLVPVNVTVQEDASEDSVDEDDERSRPLTRVDLLLNPTQMVHEHYPLPAHRGEFKGFAFSKENYERVTPDSPMFAIDCEMCQTNKCSHELSWIAVVNEHLEVVYETYVKPRNKITNYLTRYSGVTREILQDVTTRIEDVQKALRDLLPADAILCGQSLGGDLKVMQMFHPYVIDTSIIFNLSGVRHFKPSLRLLAEEFLGERIQQAGPKGHSPVEDAIATMKLVQHKLSRNVCYGDIILNNSAMAVTLQQSRNQTADNNKALKRVFFKRPGTSLCQSFFNITKGLEKPVLFVDQADNVEPYKDAPVQMQVTRSDKESVKAVRLRMCDHVMAWVQLHDASRVEEKDDGEKKNILKKLDKRIKKLVTAVYDKSLVTVLFPGRSTGSELWDAFACLQITNTKPG